MVDPSGAVVANAAVTAVHVATGVETRRESTVAGLFVIAPFQAGVYRVQASAPGFRTLVQENVIVDALSSLELSLKRSGHHDGEPYRQLALKLRF